MDKFVKYATLVVCLLILVVFSLFQSKLLKKSGSYDLNILQSEVDVRFDRYGIPHIEAANSQDTYRVLGFIMASERIFQMDLMRRLVNGKLSEVFGDKTINADIMLRKLRLKKTAESFFAKNGSKINQNILSQANAFLEGIHYYLDNHSLPVEFDLLGYKPERFEVADIMGITYYMAMTFAEGLTGDVFMSELREKLPEDKMKIIRVGADVDLDYFPSQKIVKSNFIKNLHQSLTEIKEYLPIFHGSNSWVLAPKRTKLGKAILANDPHIGASNPHIFYEAHIKYPGFELYGHFIPLNPFAALGQTPYSAWGITMAELDDLTVYQEKFDPQDLTKVMYKNEWVQVESYYEVIKIKGQKDKKIQVVMTPHGPLLDGTRYGAEGKNLSLTWSVYHPDNNVLQSLYELPLARSVDDFKRAVSHAAAPGLNISWINKQGDIAWWVLGKFPKLPDGVDYDLTLNGWDGKHEIERYYTVDENPHEVNPESGLIITANYKPQYAEFDHFDGYWQPAGRFFRIEKILSQKEKWSIEDFKKIQLDNFIPEQQKIREQVLSGLTTDKLSEYEQKVLKEFKAWDGGSDKKSIGASIYHMLNYQLTYNIFSDELGEAGFKKFASIADFWHAYKKLLLNLNHSFWDNVKTDHVESGHDIIITSFQEAVVKLQERLGQKVESWRWGRLHQAHYIHPLGKVKPLNLIYNIGPIPAAGGRYVINNLGHSKSTDVFTVVHAPATRRLIYMAKPQNR